MGMQPAGKNATGLSGGSAARLRLFQEARFPWRFGSGFVFAGQRIAGLSPTLADTASAPGAAVRAFVPPKANGAVLRHFRRIGLFALLAVEQFCASRQGWRAARRCGLRCLAGETEPFTLRRTENPHSGRGEWSRLAGSTIGNGREPAKHFEQTQRRRDLTDGPCSKTKFRGKVRGVHAPVWAEEEGRGTRRASGKKHGEPGAQNARQRP